ncbi:MAG: hypothetical protein ACK2T5_01835, partial [Anaerolineales bacterium]
MEKLIGMSSKDEKPDYALIENYFLTKYMEGRPAHFLETASIKESDLPEGYSTFGSPLPQEKLIKVPSSFEET